MNHISLYLPENQLIRIEHSLFELQLLNSVSTQSRRIVQTHSNFRHQFWLMPEFPSIGTKLKILPTIKRHTAHVFFCAPPKQSYVPKDSRTINFIFDSLQTSYPCKSFPHSHMPLNSVPVARLDVSSNAQECTSCRQGPSSTTFAPFCRDHILIRASFRPGSGKWGKKDDVRAAMTTVHPTVHSVLFSGGKRM